METSNFDISLVKCRACLAVSNKMIPLNAISIASGNMLTISEVFMMCASIQILPNDGFSQYACSGCTILAEKCYSFRKQCEKADREWKKLILGNSDDIISRDCKVEEAVTGENKIVIDIKIEDVKNKDVYEMHDKQSTTVSSDNDTPTYFKCNDCDRAFNTVSTLQKHTRKAHTKNNENRKQETQKDYILYFTIVCKICNQDIGANYLNHLHPESKNSEILVFRCKICGNEFNKLQDANKHRKVRHLNKPKMYNIWPKRCLFCPAILKSLQDKIQHDNKEHISLKKFKCDICNKLFLKRENLKIHRDAHSTQRNFICQFCGKRFNSSNYLSCHIRLHNGEKPYSCDTCGARFAFSASLRSHKLKHDPDTGKRHNCNICPASYRRLNHLNEHRRKHMGGPQPTFKCDICDKQFTCASSRKVHMVIHTGEKKFKCEECGKAFNRATNLKVHRQVHSGVKPHLCSECGRGFSQAHCLRSHVKNVHRKATEKVTDN